MGTILFTIGGEPVDGLLETVFESDGGSPAEQRGRAGVAGEQALDFALVRAHALDFAFDADRPVHEARDGLREVADADLATTAEIDRLPERRGVRSGLHKTLDGVGDKIQIARAGCRGALSPRRAIAR